MQKVLLIRFFKNNQNHLKEKHNAEPLWEKQHRALFKNMWQETLSYNLDSIKISWASNVKWSAAGSTNRK